MHVAQYEQRGPEPEKLLNVVERPTPRPGPGEALIEVLAAPINPADLLAISGSYGSGGADLPAVGGAEGVGRIVELGPDTAGPAPGARVLLPFGSGTWATHVLAPAAGLWPLPEGADTLQLAMLTCNPSAALLMLTEFVSLKPGDWVIQNAANSGVGINLIQLARQRGIRTVNVVRRISAAQTVRAAGGDVTVVDGDRLAERVREATGDADIRLGLDAVAGSACQRLADCLCEQGKVINYGLLSGEPCHIEPRQLIFRRISLEGFWRAKWFAEAGPERCKAILTELADRVADGSLRTPVEATYGLRHIQAAVAAARTPGRDGKILLEPGA